MAFMEKSRTTFHTVYGTEGYRVAGGRDAVDLGCQDISRWSDSGGLNCGL